MRKSEFWLKNPSMKNLKQNLLRRQNNLLLATQWNEQSRQGAVVSKMHFDKIFKAIETAKEEGGKILCGGNQVKPKGRCANGYFIEPTIIEGLGSACNTNMEEIFGPVVTLQSFKDVDEALELANACNYGLAATIWSQDISKANQVAAKVEAGIIWVNCWLLRDLRTPFGGIKNSGG